MSPFVVGVASNSDRILSANLARSPLFRAGVPMHVERNAPSASVAYNRILDATNEPVVVLAHHDVYLPTGWEDLLAVRLAEVEAIDPNWGVIGAYGVGFTGAHFGPVWSTSIGSIIGRVHLEPVPVQSYDELLLVIRRASGLRFDDGLPGWHLYGTDIVQAARLANLGAWTVALPCVHNDRFHESLGPDFQECYSYLKKKWAAQLPLTTPVIRVSWHGLELRRTRWRDRRSIKIRRDIAMETDVDPVRYAARCGWGNVAPSTVAIG